MTDSNAATLSNPGLSAPDRPIDTQVMHLTDGAGVVIRAIRSDDAPLLQAFVRRLSAQSRRFRFFAALNELPASQLEQFVNVDRHRSMAWVALAGEQPDGATIIAEARCVLDADAGNAEFAIAVADEFRRRGLGTRLVNRLLAYVSARGVRRLFGEIMPDNAPMLAFVWRLGFKVRTKIADPTTVIASVLPSKAFTASILGSGPLRAPLPGRIA